MRVSGEGVALRRAAAGHRARRRARHRRVRPRPGLRLGVACFDVGPFDGAVMSSVLRLHCPRPPPVIPDASSLSSSGLSRGPTHQHVEVQDGVLPAPPQHASGSKPKAGSSGPSPRMTPNSAPLASRHRCPRVCKKGDDGAHRHRIETTKIRRLRAPSAARSSTGPESGALIHYLMGQFPQIGSPSPTPVGRYPRDVATTAAASAPDTQDGLKRRPRWGGTGGV